MMAKLEEESNEKVIMEKVNYRVRWLEHQEAARRKQEEALERERVSYAQVDWHNFVVVETVDYQPWEVGNFPPPTNPSEVGARVLIQRRQEEQGSAPQPVPHGDDSDSDEETGADTQVQDMEEGSSEEDDDQPERPSKTIRTQIQAAPPVAAPVPPITARPENVTIKKYDPKAAAAQKRRADEDQFLISPITGEKIPAAQAAEHMKVGLLAPRWVEERDKNITQKAREEVVFAPGQSIESNLKNLAERRTDIFGVGDEAASEAMIGQKMGEEEVREPERSKNTWDGHSGTAEAAARAARANISVNDQIEQIHKQKGFIPEKTPEREPPRPPPPQLPPQMPPQMPPMMPPKPAPPPPSMVPQPPVMVAVRPVIPVFTPMPPMAPRPPALPPMMPPKPAPPSMTPAYIPPGMPSRPDEPPNKRPRTEDTLIPEDMFLAKNRGPVTFTVVVPVVEDKPEWKLNGQMLSVTMPLTDTVSTLKTKIMEEVGMPQGKQKLQHENIFFKDANTLAYYNMTAGTMLQLQLKERGGRKK